MEDYILSIDSGTQSVRAIIFNNKGQIVASEKTQIEPYFSTKPGYAEQNPDYYWDNLKLTTGKLLIDFPGTSKIKGVSITTQRGTVINLDKNGEALRPAIMWLDQRKAKVEKYPGFIINMGFRSVNMLGTVKHVIRDCEANWIRQNQNEIWAKTHKFLFLSGFFIFKLTGSFTDSVGSIVGYFPINYKKHRWSKPYEKNFKMFPVEATKLPELVKPSELIGYITDEASRETLIPKGTPVIASASDKACEALGSGIMEPNIAALSYGTTATIQTVHKKYIEVVKFIPPYPSAIPGYYNTEVMIQRGYWMIRWYRNEFGFKEVEEAKKLNIEPEKLFDKMLDQVPPGSMGLTLQPYWSPGVKIPGREAKGSMIGFGDVHTRVHVYRAIIEGIGYALKDGLIRTQKHSSQTINKVIVSGGGAQSPGILQITADIFDMQVDQPTVTETSALGAAINAAIGLGWYPDFKSAIEQMTSVQKTYKPDGKNKLIYKRLFNEVYLKMYKRLKPLYNSIKEITNYPEE